MTWRSRVMIPNAQRLDFTAKANRRRYSISVALPNEPPPPEGYRVLYVLDAYAFFASAVEATRINSFGSGIVVVGVGYPESPAFHQRVLAAHPAIPAGISGRAAAMTAYSMSRFYDLTLPAEADVLAEYVGGRMPLTTNDIGGLDAFLKVVETEVKPRVAELAPINPADQALFGHSLGGLAALHALFTMPNAYRTFVAGSPSIWWSRRAVLAGEAGFAAAVRAGEAKPRVLITMGADEDALPKVLPPGVDRAEAEAMLCSNRMVENGRELSARLQALNGTVPYEVGDYAVFEHQNHNISPWPALGRAISFAFPEPQ